MKELVGEMSVVEISVGEVIFGETKRIHEIVHDVCTF